MVQESLSPLGTTGSHSRRLLFHHLPLAAASVAALALFMGLPVFNSHAYPHPDLMSETFPKLRTEVSTGHNAPEMVADRHGGHESRAMEHGEASRQRGQANHGAS